MKKLFSALAHCHFSKVGAWIVSSVLAAIAACVLMFFIPFPTVLQCVLIGILTIFTILCTIVVWKSDALIGLAGWCILIAVVLWMFDISVLWSIIPLTLASFIVGSTIDGQADYLTAILCTILFFMVLGIAQNNITIKKYMQSDPVYETVVVRSFDKNVTTFFIETEQNALNFYNEEIWSKASDMGMQNGDTIKILRHPKHHNKIIDVSM